MSKTTKQKPPMTPSKLNVGDRVTVSVKNITCVNQFADKKTKDQVAAYNNATRVGTVKEVFVKTNKRGDRRHHALVLWDGYRSLTEHEQGRLKIHTESQIKKEETNQTLKTSAEKSKTSVLIHNLKTVEGKDIFTAKTEQGYVGCVRLLSGICITPDEYPSALQAANKARNLKKLLQQPATGKCEETKKKSADSKKDVVKKTSGRVTLRSKLYTFGETTAMPLLRFQEVWVIVKDTAYVQDCLNKERRSLVRYTYDRDKALYFTCHEKAKMTMRVLKSTVGPGFDLMRFFIENKES